MTKPYTYLIGWSLQQKFYYGAKWAEGCKPRDLWKKYFTSSKEVKVFRTLHGEPDIICIRKTFQMATEARKYENRVLRRMKVATRKDFLNITQSPCPSFRRKHTEETRAKMRASAPRTPRPPDVRMKISIGNKKPKNPASVVKMQAALTGFKHSAASRANMSAAMTGKKASAEHRAAISAGNSGARNSNAKSCVVFGIEFDTLKAASDYFNTSKHLIRKEPSFKFILS